MTESLDWHRLLQIVNVLSGPIVTLLIILAAILFFRQNRRWHTFCLLLGCAMIFSLRVIHAYVLLPGLGYFDRLPQVETRQIVAFNNFTVVFNLVAWLLFAGGLLMVAREHFRSMRDRELSV